MIGDGLGYVTIPGVIEYMDGDVHDFDAIFLCLNRDLFVSGGYLH